MTSNISSITINHGKENFTLIGSSRAGQATSFWIPEQKWLFDCGRMYIKSPPKIIFLTHTHADHVQALLQFHDSNRRDPIPVYVPASAEEALRNYFQAFTALTQTEIDKFELRPVEAGALVELPNQYFARIIQCHHRIDCLGYSIYKRRRKLKEEYQGMEGKEINALRKSGIEVMAETQEPVLCYLGDTTHQVFTNHPEILREHDTIVVECSFIDPKDEARADETMHMHWNRLRPVVEQHPSTLFVLTHFSLKYKTSYLRDFYRENSLHSNIHPVLGHDSSSSSMNEPLLPPCICFQCTKK